MNHATFVFDIDTTKEALIVTKSLDPEIKHRIPKTNVEVTQEKNRFSLKIESQDVSSLRAASNSYLRWINTILAVKKIV